MKREWTLEVQCTEPGCGERHRYRYDTKRDLQQSFEMRHMATYKCVRHTKGAGVVTPINPRVEWLSEPLRQESYGRYWGHSGLITGRGHYADAADFPVGTRLRITCEALPPDPTPADKP